MPFSGQVHLTTSAVHTEAVHRTAESCHSCTLKQCYKRRELRKKRFEPEESEKYKAVNNIKRRMKKSKENWIGEQCSEIEENLRKNNSKRAYQMVKDLTTVKQAKATTVQDVQENASQKNERY